jgi:hypothetical protein
LWFCLLLQWVADGSPSHSTPIKVESPNQFVPLGTTKKEFKKIQAAVSTFFTDLLWSDYAPEGFRLIARCSCSGDGTMGASWIKTPCLEIFGNVALSVPACRYLWNNNIPCSIGDFYHTRIEYAWEHYFTRVICRTSICQSSGE